MVSFVLPEKEERVNMVAAPHEFLALETPHPYGVKPLGNQWLEADHNNGNKSANTSLRESLTDEMWVEVLSFCNGSTLASLLQTCRFMYVVGHQPELWRDLVLRSSFLVGGGGSNPPVVQLSQMKNASCWKDVFVQLYCQERRTNKKSLPTRAYYRPHIPMTMPNIYSDYLHQLHRCRMFAIPKGWLQGGPKDKNQNTGSSNITTVDGSRLTSQDFRQQFEVQNKPCVIRGGCKSWKAFRDWQDPSYLIQQQQHDVKTNPEQSGDVKVFYRATSGAAPLSAEFSLQAYHDYCTKFSHFEEAPLYLFDRTALLPSLNNISQDKTESSPTTTGSSASKLRIAKALHDDYYPDLQQSCPYFDPDLPGNDLLQYLGAIERPDHTWLIAGPQRSGSVFHIDPNCTHAWNATIRGRKRWIFYPPNVTPPGVHPSPDGDEVALPLSLGEWIHTFWPEHVQRCRNSSSDEMPLECTAHPGDIMFVPHGWWHLVINLDEGMNIAITHNYISQSNLGDSLLFFRNKQDHISGCRDRKEAIQPDKIDGYFREVLQSQFDIKRTSWLSQALNQGRFACPAWRLTRLHEKEHADNDKDDEQQHYRQINNKRRRTKITPSGNNIMLKAKVDESESAVAAPFRFSFLD